MARWVRVAAATAVVEGHPLAVSAEDVDLALYRVGDAVYATDDECSHAQASLSEGEQEGYLITCPRHGGQFDIRSGRAVHLPAFAPIRVYPVKVEGGAVWVDLEPD